MTTFKSVLNWSGGKDSALALYHHQQNPHFQLQGLFSTINKDNQRISMHGVTEQLIEDQAKALNIPLEKLYLPSQPTMEQYNEILDGAFEKFRNQEISHLVYGDIFLEDIKSYREKQLDQEGLKADFPLWGRSTKKLMQEFLDLGFKAIVVSISEKVLDKSFCGRDLDQAFLDELPGAVDSCGENGEFHTFVYDGPDFRRPVNFSKGHLVHKTFPSPTEPGKDMGFWFCELKPD